MRHRAITTGGGEHLLGAARRGPGFDLRCWRYSFAVVSHSTDRKTLTDRALATAHSDNIFQRMRSSTLQHSHTRLKTHTRTHSACCAHCSALRRKSICASLSRSLTHFSSVRRAKRFASVGWLLLRETDANNRAKTERRRASLWLVVVVVRLVLLSAACDAFPERGKRWLSGFDPSCSALPTRVVHKCCGVKMVLDSCTDSEHKHLCGHITCWAALFDYIQI